MKEEKSRFGLNLNDNSYSSLSPNVGGEILSNKNINDDSDQTPEEPEKCPNCGKMIHPYDKNTHPAVCNNFK